MQLSKVTGNLAIILNGPPRSGKDTVQEIISSELSEERVITFTDSLSIVDPMRELLYLGLKASDISIEDKDYAYRNFLAKTKELMETLYPNTNMPCNIVFHHADSFFHKLDDMYATGIYRVFFTYMRRQEDMKYFMNKCSEVGYPCISIYVNRPCKESSITKEDDEARESNKDHYDYVIDNTGTLEEFEAKIREFYKNTVRPIVFGA